MKIKKVIILVLCISIFAGVAIFAVKRKKAALAKAKPVGENPIPVSVVSVKKADFISQKRYVGIIEPLNTADISSRITADVVKVFCREGKSVKKGELLIKLDDRNLVQAITVLKAKLEGIKTQIVSNNVNRSWLSQTLLGVWKAFYHFPQYKHPGHPAKPHWYPNPLSPSKPGRHPSQHAPGNTATGTRLHRTTLTSLTVSSHLTPQLTYPARDQRG